MVPVIRWSIVEELIDGQRQTILYCRRTSGHRHTKLMALMCFCGLCTTKCLSANVRFCTRVSQGGSQGACPLHQAGLAPEFGADGAFGALQAESSQVFFL